MHKVPSIIVHNGSHSMERTVRTQRTLSKQDEIDEGDEVECYENGKSSGGDSSGGEATKADEPTSNNNNNNNNINNNVLHRSRSQSKVKLLVRSHAVREETSPPPEPPCASPPPPAPGGSPPHHHHHHSASSSSSTVGSTPSNGPQPPQPGLRVRHKLRREGSSQGSTDSWEPTLSRGNSREQYDSGNTVDLQQFIVETLNRNYKDRMLLLKIETELLNLAKDSKRTVHKFGQMSSYQRMLVHRVAAYFNMEHNVDPTGASVIVNTTKATRVPEKRFKELLRSDTNPPPSTPPPPPQTSPQQPRPKEDLLLPEEPRKSILKRDSSSFDETGCFKSGDRMLNGESRRSKSFEEREEEYEKARRRIFNREHSGDGEVECMDELHWEGDSGVCTQCDRAQTHSNSIDRNVRLLKVESYECGDTLRANSLRLSVSKSHSFNGYDPPLQHNSRILTKQDSGSSMSSRISPSSSGYKSQRSDATLSATPSPTATPNLHTQTGQPYTNPDGSIYHFDPANPPRVLENTSSGGSSGNSGGGSGGGGECRGGGGKQQQGPTSQGHCVVENESVQTSSQDKQTQPISHYEPPPPLPQDTRICAMANGSYGGGMSYGMGGTQGYNMIVPPPQEPPTPPYHPLVCPNYLPHQYDPRISESSQSGDLASYMMGLSLDSRPEPRPPPVYWPSHHIQGSSTGGAGVPVYYTAAAAGGPGGGGAGGGGAAAHRLYQPHQPASFAPQLPPPPPPPPPPPHPTTDHTGACYGPSYASTGQECVPYAPASSTLHMYYTAPCNNGMCMCDSGGAGGVGGSQGGYYGGAPCGAPLLALQYQQPCAHPTPPHTPQGVCGQFAVYNGCYPTHYAPPNSALPVSQLFRKPALQVGMRCGSPLRGAYPGSPTVKEREDKPPPPPPPPPPLHHPPLPVYGFRVVPVGGGEMRLLGNAGRIPFALPATKATHTRKHRSKGGGGGSMAGGSRGSQQQAALATAIEVAGLHSKA